MLRRKLAARYLPLVCYYLPLQDGTVVFILLQEGNDSSYNIISASCDAIPHSSQSILKYAGEHQGSFYELSNEYHHECHSSMTMYYMYWYDEDTASVSPDHLVDCWTCRSLSGQVRWRRSWSEELSQSQINRLIRRRSSRRAYSVLINNQFSLYDFCLRLTCTPGVCRQMSHRMRTCTNIVVRSTLSPATIASDGTGMCESLAYCSAYDKDNKKLIIRFQPT